MADVQSIVKAHRMGLQSTTESYVHCKIILMVHVIRYKHHVNLVEGMEVAFAVLLMYHSRLQQQKCSKNKNKNE